MSQCGCFGNESTKNIKPHQCPALREDLRKKLDNAITTLIHSRDVLKGLDSVRQIDHTIDAYKNVLKWASEAGEVSK